MAEHSKLDYKEGMAIYIPSCDAYSDLWTPFFNLFFRYWADCPYRIYLGANSRHLGNSRVTTLFSDKGLVWADRCLDHLAQIPEEHVLVCLEDFFLRKTVNTQLIAEAHSNCIRLNAHVFRLVCRPGPKALTPGEKFGELRPGDPYRISTQAAIWRRKSLMEMILPGESIWEFELNGTPRTVRYTTGFYGVQRDLLPYRHHVIERGKWFPWEAWVFARQKIGCDFQSRKIMSPLESTRWLLNKSASMGLAAMPSAARQSLVNVVRVFRRSRGK